MQRRDDGDHAARVMEVLTAIDGIVPNAVAIGDALAESRRISSVSQEFRRAGIDVFAISTDPVDRSKMLAGFLRTKIPLLSDTRESLIAPLGLMQHHRNGEPDNAIPAFFIVDRNGVVRWIFTSDYYREMPRPETLLNAAKSVSATPTASPQ